MPARKVTQEIADIRGVPKGEKCVSPPSHPEFSTPVGLLEFMALLRELSGGKPAGFKLCIGQKTEFLAVVKAILATGITPDFITIDGAEGGTGAGPVEFSDHVGLPLTEGLMFAQNALVGAGLRDKLTLAASGKVATGFEMAVSSPRSATSTPARWGLRRRTRAGSRRCAWTRPRRAVRTFSMRRSRARAPWPRPAALITLSS